MPRIIILMSTYNGDDYVEDQIRSIYEQTFQDFQLVIRDDGSEPVFLQKLEKLQRTYGFRLIEGKNAGFARSFMALLEKAGDAELYAFADQDDIWLPEKLQIAINWFDRHQREDIPQLFHNAYDIVDSDTLKKTGHFFFSEEGYDFRRSITENHYSGFSMVINQRLRKMMLRGRANRIVYHDWWAGMIAHAFGEAYSDPEVASLHRAHGDNVTTFSMKTRLQWLKKSLNTDTDIKTRSAEFARCFAKDMEPKDLRMLRLFARKRYSLRRAMKKAFYPKRWRPILSSEVISRFLMLIGRM